MARSGEGKQMDIHAGSKGAFPLGSLLANIPWFFGFFCLKLVPSYVLEPPSSSAYVDILASFVAFVFQLGAEDFVGLSPEASKQPGTSISWLINGPHDNLLPSIPQPTQVSPRAF
ncbi:unnamed protein product [Prunus armeniaca]